MKKTFARLSAASFAALASVSAFAQDNPIVTSLSAVELAGVAAGVAAAGLLIVAIALTMKGPDVAKRVIRKV